MTDYVNVCGLFARSRTSDPRTSHAAAATVEGSGTAHSHRELIAECVEANPGIVVKELAHKCGLTDYAVSKRMSELARAGRIVPGAPRLPAEWAGGGSCAQRSWWPKEKA